MKLDEIIAHNKTSIESCTEKQVEYIHNNIHSLREDKDTKFLFKSCQKFGGFEPGKLCKYVCTCLCWNKDLDTFCGFIQFGFNDHDSLRSNLQNVLKNNSNIVCHIISIYEEDR